MHRAKLMSLLTRYNPTYQEEQVFKSQFVKFVEENADCFERSLQEGHITASSWLLNKDGSKALLMHHRKLDSWFQLGGHADGDGDVLGVAIKEAQEESGVESIVAVSPAIYDLDIHMIPANSKDGAHLHYDVRFLLQMQSDAPLMMNEREAKALQWIGKGDAEHLPLSPSVKRLHDKWVKYPNF